MQCVHFRALFGLLVAASLSGTVALKSKSKEKFGFYFPVHSQIPSTLNVLKGVRKYYPTSPIYLLQDGGNVDFGKLCQARSFGRALMLPMLHLNMASLKEAKLIENKWYDHTPSNGLYLR